MAEVVKPDLLKTRRPVPAMRYVGHEPLERRAWMAVLTLYRTFRGCGINQAATRREVFGWLEQLMWAHEHNARKVKH